MEHSMQKFAFATLAVAGLAASAMAHDVVMVAQSPTGQLVGYNRQHHPALLEPSAFSELTGWVATDFGFEALAFDDPDADLFVANPGADIGFRLLSADGVDVKRDNGVAGFMAINELYLLGNPYFHVHPIFQTQTPDFDSPVSITVQLIDRNNIHADSAPITMRFQAVPTPGALGLLGLAGLASRRRRA
jgi:hypothetical protein